MDAVQRLPGSWSREPAHAVGVALGRNGARIQSRPRQICLSDFVVRQGPSLESALTETRKRFQPGIQLDHVVRSTIACASIRRAAIPLLLDRSE